MIIAHIGWVILVLAGLAGCLWFLEALGGNWLDVARVPVRQRRPVGPWDRGSSESPRLGDPFWPPPPVGIRWGPRRYHLVPGKRKRELRRPPLAVPLSLILWPIA